MRTAADPLTAPDVHFLVQLMGAERFSRLSPTVLDQVLATPISDARAQQIRDGLNGYDQPAHAALLAGIDPGDAATLGHPTDRQIVDEVMAETAALSDEECAARFRVNVDTARAIRELLAEENAR